ncbi:major facilitator superfamily domain-containing protein [Naematelia encephala]|uniref:Major facilitator superfamily domain-containing protein n=1 Tax=Naematelia encephala TaxID=71784 RepID=A0A1Y2B7W2_9TREE|nr:major facilitator superfamily domain-containing protein [Naematelia encephala]
MSDLEITTKYAPPGEEVKEVEVGDSSYQEFLILSQEFQGKRLDKLTRKIDWHVLPQLIFIYLLSYVDRTNVGNAKLFGAQVDMKMTAQDWNTGLTVFFVTYAIGGPPSNMALKRIGPKKVLPFILACVSLILIGSGCASNRAQWFALRLLLGLFEAGMFPGCCYTLTTWYTPEQIHGRTTIYYCGASLAGAFSGLLAYAIGQADGIWGYRGWRWVYVLEGIFSFIVAMLAFFFLQETPEKQGKWLKEDERRFLVLRNKFMYGGEKGASDDTFRMKDFVTSLKSWHNYVLGFAFFSTSVAAYGLSFTLPTIVKNMGFSAARAQGLSAPPYVFACFCVLLSGWFSDRYRMRMWSTALPSAVAFIGLLIAVLTVTHKNLVPLSYIGVCLAAGGVYCLSPSIAVWIGLNQAGQTKRAASIGLTIFIAQLGGIVGSNIYLTKEAPSYHTGFGCSLAFLGAGCIVVPMIYWYILGRINAKREAMSEEEIYARYSPEELQEMGDLSPLYRYER